MTKTIITALVVSALAIAPTLVQAQNTDTPSCPSGERHSLVSGGAPVTIDGHKQYWMTFLNNPAAAVIANFSDGSADELTFGASAGLAGDEGFNGSADFELIAPEGSFAQATMCITDIS